MSTKIGLPVLIVLLAALAPAAARAVIVGQNDTFQDGTTANWTNGGTPPANVSTAGPGGAGDRFMELTADGSGSNGRLTAFNRSQWLGDYISAGVTEIDMDLNNFRCDDGSGQSLGFLYIFHRSGRIQNH